MDKSNSTLNFSGRAWGAWLGATPYYAQKIVLSNKVYISSYSGGSVSISVTGLGVGLSTSTQPYDLPTVTTNNTIMSELSFNGSGRAVKNYLKDYYLVTGVTGTVENKTYYISVTNGK